MENYRMKSEIVCYNGGACGDLIVSLIDATDVDLDIANGKIVLSSERIRFKKPHSFANDDEKDKYLDFISNKFMSIPSHDLKYHLDRSHDILGITVDDYKIALWAAIRFKNLHRPHVWQEMSKFCNGDSIEKYAQIMIDFSKVLRLNTNKIIRLEDIVSGQLISKLESVINKEISIDLANIYINWLSSVNKTYKIC